MMGRLEVLARARARAAESEFSETIQGGIWTDGVDANLNATRVLSTERYSGPARIKYGSDTVSDETLASQTAATRTPICKIPVDGALLYEGDEIVVTASLADASLVNRRYRIAAPAAAGQVTSHRYPLIEIS